MDNGVVLRRGRTILRVQGADARRVVEQVLLAASTPGGRSDEELLATFPEETREPVGQLLTELKARRILDPADAGDSTDRQGGESEEDIFYWHFGASEAQVHGDLAARRLVLVGVNTLSLALSAALVRAGFGDPTIVDYPLLGNLRLKDGDVGRDVVEYAEWLQGVADSQIDCLVATTDFGGPALLRPWNTFAVRNHIRFLPIVISDLIGTIGPFVVPGEGPCLECLLARENSQRDEPTLIRQVENRAFEGQVVNGLHPSVSVVVAEIAAFELSRLYGAWLPQRIVGRAIEVNLLATQVASRRVLRVPRCPACGPWQTQSWTSPERDALMPGIE